MSKGLGASPGHMSGAELNSHAAKKCQIYERLAKQILNCNAKDANGLGYYQNKKVWNRGQSLKPASGQKKKKKIGGTAKSFSLVSSVRKNRKLQEKGVQPKTENEFSVLPTFCGEAPCGRGRVTHIICATQLWNS